MTGQNERLKLDCQNLGLRVVLFVLVASPSLDCATHTTAQPGSVLVGHAPRVRRPRVRMKPPATAIRCRSNADCGDVAGTTCRSTSTKVSVRRQAPSPRRLSGARGLRQLVAQSAGVCSTTFAVQASRIAERTLENESLLVEGDGGRS